MWYRFHPVRSGYKQQPKKAWSPRVVAHLSLSLVISLVLSERVARPVFNSFLCRGLLRECRKLGKTPRIPWATLRRLWGVLDSGHSTHALCEGGEGTGGSRSFLLTPCSSLHSSQCRRGYPAFVRFSRVRLLVLSLYLGIDSNSQPSSTLRPIVLSFLPGC